MNDLGVYLLLPVRRPHSANLLEGLKSIEVRKQRLGSPAPALIYESGKDGFHRILGMMMMGKGVPVTPKSLPLVLKGAMLTREDYDRYADGRPTWAHPVWMGRRFRSSLTLAAVGVERAPQSWQYVTVDATIIRGAMHHV